MPQSHGRRRRRVSAGSGWTDGPIAKLRTHPLRGALFGAIGLLLSWLTLAKTLPFALASLNPDYALALNPSNPAALIAKATLVRERMLAPKADAAPQGTVSGQPVDAFEKLPPAESKSGEAGHGGETDNMRRQIQTLAARALKSDPLNAQAFELMASVADDAESARSLMQAAAARSRHAAGALFWLANDSLRQRDYGRELEYVDLLLRTRPAVAV